MDVTLFLSLFTGHAEGFKLLCVNKIKGKDNCQWT